MTQANAVKEMSREQEQRRLNDYLEVVRLEAVKELIKKAVK